MSVDLKRLPADEEELRVWANNASWHGFSDDGRPVQNVLDALNYFRCKAKFAEQELYRAQAELTAKRESAEFGSWS
jgi:hypothetical protein